MKVSRIDKNGDWTFGKGRANYARDSQAIKQKIETRIRSVRNDYFLNVLHGIDWFRLLSERGTAEQIRQVVAFTIFDVFGVASVERVDVETDAKKRKVKIIAAYTDVFGVNEEITVNDAP